MGKVRSFRGSTPASGVIYLIVYILYLYILYILPLSDPFIFGHFLYTRILKANAVR